MLIQYLRGFVFSSSACMHGSISSIPHSLALFSGSSALLQAHHSQDPQRLSGLSVFERAASGLSLRESSLQ